MTCSTRASDQVVVPLDCNRYDRFLTQPAIRHLMTDIRRVKRCIIIIIIITEYAERGLKLSNGRMSVHPSVSLSRRSTAAAACGWFAADRGCRCGQRHVESRGTRLSTDSFHFLVCCVQRKRQPQAASAALFLLVSRRQ